ncbi:flagellar motor stator protein MotA [Tepidicaulis sp. LMO-SS28]|uniref:flagellar motor stator protein MotA n=1 Tax=Tepidicaulis sp. LMO-SS28 TaxID=3447455 RepID=UPI003EE00907
MKFLIGCVIVVGSVVSGYAIVGGHFEVLWQPAEFIIILGAAIGALIIGNPPAVLKNLGRAFIAMLKGPKYKKEAYLELLSMQYTLFKLAKAKGSLALEQHVENPEESDIFQRFPTIVSDHHALEFLRDYLRLVTLGTENPHEVEALMDEELETHHQENERMVAAIQALADGTPALGIVAAVLGVIHTMGAIDQPPEILGHLIGAALVGTFFGVFCAYGFFAPMAMALKNSLESETKFYLSIKAGILAHLQGYAPAVSIEFARKALMSEVRPTFEEVEEATQNLKAA